MANRPEKTAFFLDDFRCGGVQDVFIKLINFYLARNTSVDAVVLEHTGEFLGRLDPRARVVNLRRTRLRKAILPLSDYIRRELPDIIMCGQLEHGVIALLAAAFARSKARIVAAVQSDLHFREASLIDRMTRLAWMRFFIPHFARVICVSDGIRRFLQEDVGIASRNIKVIYNPVVSSVPSHEELAQPSHRFFCKEGVPVVVSVGRLVKDKGFSTLVEAMGNVVQQVDCRLIVVGEGPERSSLQSMIDASGLKDRIDLAGYRDDVHPFLAHADLVVVPSLREGFGNVIVEALSHGKQVVCTACSSGPLEILDHGKFGCIVPPEDPARMAEAVVKMLSCRQFDEEALIRRAHEFSCGKALDSYYAELSGA